MATSNDGVNGGDSGTSEQTERADAMPLAPSRWLRGLVASRTPELWLTILLLEIAALAALLWCSLAHVSWLPSAGHVLGGVLPVIVPWAAALGGATHALWGLVFHWAKYRDDSASTQASAMGQGWKWNAFYPTRIILGAIFGTVATLIVVYVTKSVELGDGVISSTGKVVLFVIAFVVGFRQEYFQALVERVAAIILASPKRDDDPAPKDGGPSLALSGPTEFGNVADDAAESHEFWVENLTDRAVKNAEVRMSGKDAGAFTVAPDGGKIPGDPRGPLARVHGRARGGEGHLVRSHARGAQERQAGRLGGAERQGGRRAGEDARA